jgi:hypothetical protein
MARVAATINRLFTLVAFVFGIGVSSYWTALKSLEPSGTMIYYSTLLSPSAKQSCQCPLYPPLAKTAAAETNGAVKSVTEEESSKEETATRSEALFGKYCDATILGEKQPWNKHKKVISYSVFAPVSNNTDVQDLPQWVKDGTRIQAETAKQFYPDWVLRFYTTVIGLCRPSMSRNSYSTIMSSWCDVFVSSPISE